MNLQQIRSDTPLTASTIYLDTAAASLPPDPVLEVVRQYLLDTGHKGIYQPGFRRETYARVESVRAQLAELIEAGPDEIAFTKNGSEAISLIAQAIPWQPGDEVLVADTEMLSNLLPWKRLEQQRQIRVKMVPADAQGRLHAEAFAAAIGPRTRLLTFSHLPNSTGAVQPAADLCAVARRHGVLSLVNASQSLGLLPTSVRQLDCDFLCACGRKGLRATEGSGFLFARAQHLPRLEPALVGWWNGVYDRATGALSLQPSARRFEAGCPNVPAILGLGAALDYLRAIGIAVVHARLQALTAHAVARLSALPGLTIYGPLQPGQRLGIVPFNIQGIAPEHLVERLAAQGCVIEAGAFMADAILARHGVDTMARLSLHYFNTDDEIDRCASLLDACR